MQRRFDTKKWIYSDKGTITMADPGGPRPHIFGKVSLILLHCIQCLKKIFLKLNLDFIVAEIRGVFGSVGGVCVCV